MQNIDPINEAKRGRGRPRKFPLPDLTLPKRGRGRPRKDAPSPDPQIVNEFLVLPSRPTHAFPAPPKASNLAKQRRIRARLRSINVSFPMKTWLTMGALLMVIIIALIIGRLLPKPKPTIKLSGRAALIADINRVTELPTGEDPKIYTVTDQNKVGQPFLENAINGDQVLVYAQAKKAYVYRPRSAKIITIGPVLSPAAGSSPVAPRVVLFNGSNTPGITVGVETKLVAANPTITILAKDKAAKSDYLGISVIDLSSGKLLAVAKSLATTLGGQVVSMPSGESTPTADILVIVGN